MLIRIRQQREVTRALHRGRELALVGCTRAGNSARHDLAGLGDVGLQRREILVVDLFDAFGGEAAEFLAAEVTGHRGISCSLRRYSRSLSTGSSAKAGTSLPKSGGGRRPSRGGRPPCASRASSSSRAFAMNDGSVTASSRAITRWRSTASLKRNAPTSSSSVGLSTSMFSSR